MQLAGSPRRGASTCPEKRAARGRVLLWALLVALAVLGPAGRAAASGPRFSLKALGTPPGLSYFVFGATPGAAVKGSFRIANEGDRAGSARLYAVDATTGETTGAVYRSQGRPRRDVGAWIQLPVDELTLAPGESRTVRFSLPIPDDAQAGQHLGGIVAQNTTLTRGGERSTERGTFRVNVRNLTILAVEVDLPGQRVERLALTGVEPGAAEGFQTLQVGMRNRGNRLLKGSGRLVVSAEDGEQLKAIPFNVDTFVPHTAVQDPIAVPGQALPAGRYRAIVTVRYGRGQIARLATWFTITSGQIRQVFEPSRQSPPGSGGSSDLLPLAIVALGFLVVAFLLGKLVMLWRDGRL